MERNNHASCRVRTRASILAVMKCVLIAGLLLLSFPLQAAEPNPYSALTPEQRNILQTGIERYVSDQVKKNWGDLWEIQDQTVEVKRELLLGEVGPNMDRKQFVKAMEYTIESGGFPHLKKFELQEVRPDKGNFLVVGCGTGVRESFHFHGIVIFGARIVGGKPIFDIFSFVSDTCS